MLDSLQRALRDGRPAVECSLDLGRSTARVEIAATGWRHAGDAYPWPTRLKPRTIYRWDGADFVPLVRYDDALVKLVPTGHGAPTFEIDGIKMLPTAHVSPYDDARDKVDLVDPAGCVVLDTCGGLGYFAAWCLARGARHVISYEKRADVLWLRDHNPWSPAPDSRLTLVHGDVVASLDAHTDGAFDAVLHDPPRFGIAGELYSAEFYAGLARVLKRGGRLFHYTGTPNRLTTGRDVPGEVLRRLRACGFDPALRADGVLAVRR
ncbi:MAG: SAM-dependent methyltransferase [Gammaproteobacteria bacterium]